MSASAAAAGGGGAAKGQAIDLAVIGASAGGVEALGKLLPELPVELSVPVVIVVHIPADRPSLLPSVFAARCRVPVKEAEDKEPLSPGVVYFAPPGYHVLVEDDRTLALSVDEPVLFSRPSIDVLFESAAEALGDRVLAFLLTGASTDGVAGLQALQRAGAVTVVQDPEDAAVPDLPRSALAQCRPRHVLPLAQMVPLLQALATRR